MPDAPGLVSCWVRDGVLGVEGVWMPLCLCRTADFRGLLPAGHPYPLICGGRRPKNDGFARCWQRSGGIFETCEPPSITARETSAGFDSCVAWFSPWGINRSRFIATSRRWRETKPQRPLFPILACWRVSSIAGPAALHVSLSLPRGSTPEANLKLPTVFTVLVQTRRKDE